MGDMGTDNVQGTWENGLQVRNTGKPIYRNRKYTTNILKFYTGYPNAPPCFNIFMIYQTPLNFNTPTHWGAKEPVFYQDFV